MLQFYFNGVPVGTPGTGLTAWGVGAISFAALGFGNVVTAWSGYEGNGAFWDTPLSVAEMAYLYGG